MKVEKFLNQLSGNEEDCQLCELHTLAYEQLPDGMTCPKCHQVMDEYMWDGLVDYQVVGETNGVEADEEITKYQVGQCECGATLAMIPTEITYNANHDIYYTGGKKYLKQPLTGLKEAIKPSIEQYTERIKNGENLNADHLCRWLDYKIEEAVATYLYENGFKK